MPRRVRPKAVVIGSMVTLGIGQAGCETDIVAAPIAVIEVEPAQFSIAVGEEQQLSAELRDDAGNSLVGYPIIWQSNNEAVAFVDAQGKVRAVGQGVAEISARVDGTVGASIVTVTPSPAIGLSPQSVTFAATIGGPGPGTRMVRITNAGPGTLSDLTASVRYGDGQAVGWLTFAFDAAAAPTDLRLVATTDGLPPGTYDAAVTIQSAHPGVTPRVLPVQLILGEPLPVIDIETESITFNMVAGGAPPDPVAIAITNVGGGTLSGLGASITYAQGQPTGWLSTSLTPSTAPATLSVSFLAASLGVGTYNAEIAIVAAQAVNSPRTLDVTLVVQDAPRIGLSGSIRSFTAQAGGADPTTQSVLVNNIGGGELAGLSASVQYQAGQPTGWLAANLSSTSAPSTLVLVPSLGSLAPGTYAAVVLISAPAASNSPQTVQVTLTVTPPPASIVLSRDTVTFETTVGDPGPTPVEVQISNGGGGTLDGLAADVVYGQGASDWLNATLSATTAPATLTLTPDPGPLAEGSYSATVTVTATASTERVIDVELIVLPPEPQPGIGLSALVADFEAIEGGTDPAPVDLQVTNSGDGELTGLDTSETYGDGETGWLAVGLDSQTAPATLTLTATLGSLVPGTYTATVSVTAPDALNSPQMVQVSFVVQPAPPATPPAAPSGLQSNSQGESSIGITWLDNSDDETHFIAQRSPTDVEDQSVWLFSVELPPDTSEYTHTDLAAGTEYRLRVLACNANGCSASEVITEQTQDD